MEGVREGAGKGARASNQGLVARQCEWGSTLVSTIRVSTHLPPIRAHRGGIVRGRRGRERRAGSCGLGETQNALPGATATDIRRTRTNISTRRSVMRCVPPLGTRPNTRRRMGCARRGGWTKERLRGGRHGKWTDPDGICPTRDPGCTTPLEYGYYCDVELAPSTSAPAGRGGDRHASNLAGFTLRGRPSFS